MLHHVRHWAKPERWISNHKCRQSYQTDQQLDDGQEIIYFYCCKLCVSINAGAVLSFARGNPWVTKCQTEPVGDFHELGDVSEVKSKRFGSSARGRALFINLEMRNVESPRRHTTPH